MRNRRSVRDHGARHFVISLLTMSDTHQAKKVAVLTVFTSETAKGNAAAVVITPERLSFAERTKLGV